MVNALQHNLHSLEGRKNRCGISTMTRASVPTARTKSPAVTLFFWKPQRIGFLPRLLEALHQSRRLQAEDFLRAHHHLLADSRDRCGQSSTRDDENVDR
jgi:hypothetical protein